MDLYVATNGNDAWSGTFATPNRDKTDGPLATIAAARDRIRTWNHAGRIYAIRDEHTRGELTGPVTVHVRGGRYEVTAPIVFGPDDSYPVTYKAYRDEKPVIDGGRRIEGWRATTVNGKSCIVALPAGAAVRWTLRELFVNDRRAARPRFPAQGLFRMAEAPGMKLPNGWGAGGYTQFVCAEGDVQPYANLTDIEVVYVHFWIEERSPIESFDPDARLVTMARPSRAPLVGSFGSQLADYYLDNLFEAVTEPGQWYPDRREGQLYYLPKRGQTPANTEVYAPFCTQLLAVVGDVDTGRHVEQVRFEGITFRHTDWRHPSNDGASVLGSSDPANTGYSRRHSRGNAAAAAQAACDVPGVVTFHGARHCALENCIIEHVGWYGVEIGDGCHHVRLVGNTIRDMGAGGVKINGAAAREQCPARATRDHTLTDNEITEGGRLFHSAVRVLSMHAAGMVIAHNHVHDLYYTGVSCGWEWGYHESISRNNLIAYNHIHDIGQGLLSDMGGIYTLGVQPGTVLRGNHIHDIRSAHYGGWCIYPDEGSSHLLIEDNVCYDADRQAFHQHYGRENVIRNNIFAFGGEAVGRYSRTEPHRGYTFMRNILVTEGRPIFAAGCKPDVEARRHTSDANLIFDASGRRPYWDVSGRKLSLTAWRKLGHDLHSVIADPKFPNLAERDLRLASDSPAFKLGFKPIDMTNVGPRPKSKRV